MAARTQFEHRSFVGAGSSRPSPEVIFESDEGMLVVATPWGSRSSVNRFVKTITDYYLSSRSDSDVTSPFKRLTNLSTAANNLRVAVLLANEELYRDENKDVISSGIELFVGIRNEQELTWIQVGHPNCLLARPSRPLLLPMSVNLDLSAELSGPQQNLPVLPSQLLGVDPNPNLWIGAFRPHSGDQLILISKSWIPESLVTTPQDQRSLDHLTTRLTSDSENPYWLGIWKML